MVPLAPAGCEITTVEIITKISPNYLLALASVTAKNINKSIFAQVTQANIQTTVKTQSQVSVAISGVNAISEIGAISEEKGSDVYQARCYITPGIVSLDIKSIWYPGRGIPLRGKSSSVCLRGKEDRIKIRGEFEKV